MTPREKRIWDAAYAAAFVAEFNVNASFPHGSFDGASDNSSAERAITVADLAVQRLREWRKYEKPLSGEKIRRRE